MFDLTAESVKVIRTAVEFSWKEPMVSMLRDLGVNSRPHTRQLLETVVANLRPMKIAVTYAQQARKQSLWDIMFGAPEPPSVREQCEVIECVEGILSDADTNMGTHFIAEVTPPNADTARRFDFSLCSQLLPHWKSLAKPYEFPPLVALLTKINEYLNRTAVVSVIAGEYSKDSGYSSYATYSGAVLANYGVLLGFFVVFLFARYGIWALVPVLLTSFICAMFCLAAEDL
ncbi:hypothetical protein TELCIR_10518 [Teladorsagia circumcincta]|uniref:Uncharacterized protein n=1 Tax=Teladorsagia circumcincta TaxID=45464 RepID=A0A2G9UBX0_TELCI|nr:hypothetical protein TELCIR_10518 [Teladorsagia circumcincta]